MAIALLYPAIFKHCKCYFPSPLQMWQFPSPLQTWQFPSTLQTWLFPSRQKILLNKLHCNDQVILLNTLIDTVTHFRYTWWKKKKKCRFNFTPSAAHFGTHFWRITQLLLQHLLVNQPLSNFSFNWRCHNLSSDWLLMLQVCLKFWDLEHCPPVMWSQNTHGQGTSFSLSGQRD